MPLDGNELTDVVALQNLAYAEMRSILARVLWNFDMELCKDSDRWPDQSVFSLWDKKPLNVKLRAREIKAS